MQKTLFDKIWDSHLVIDNNHNEYAFDPSGPSLIYIDRHLIHEVTSPQAFASLKQVGRKVRRPNLTIATTDHNVSTESRSLPIVDEVSKTQLETLSRNCKEFGITIYDMSIYLIYVAPITYGMSTPRIQSILINLRML